MKNLAVTVLAILGALFLLINLIPFDCEVDRIISTQSPTNSHKVEIHSKTCKKAENSGIFLRVEEYEKNKISETKFLSNGTNDIKYNWKTTNDLNIVLPENSKTAQRSGELQGINYEFIFN